MNRDRSTPGVDVVVERLIAAPANRVWAIAGSADGLRRWLGMLNFQPRVGGRILLDQTAGATEADPRLIVYGRVRSFEPERGLAFSWCGFYEDRSFWPVDTLVELSLLEQAGGTLVTLAHRGFEGLAGAAGAALYRAYHHCWVDTAYMQRLDEYSGGEA